MVFVKGYATKDKHKKNKINKVFTEGQYLDLLKLPKRIKEKIEINGIKYEITYSEKTTAEELFNTLNRFIVSESGGIVNNDINIRRILEEQKDIEGIEMETVTKYCDGKPIEISTKYKYKEKSTCPEIIPELHPSG